MLMKKQRYFTALFEVVWVVSVSLPHLLLLCIALGLLPSRLSVEDCQVAFG